MSELDQSVLIANCCYHVGHERSVKVADDRGFFIEEGLISYTIERGGILPAEWEREALGRVMWERGIDIATAVNVRAAIIQRARGEDMYIVGGWRTQTQVASKLIGAKGLTRPDQLRGARIPNREPGNLGYHCLAAILRTFDIDPEREIEWIERRETAYGDEADPGDQLRSGAVTLLPCDGRVAQQLLDEGYPLLYEVADYFNTLSDWPPGKVIVATRQMIEQRAEELAAFLRANVRAYWYVNDPANYDYNFELETRMRAESRNPTERRVRMLRTTNARVPRDMPTAMEHMVMDGLVPRRAIAGLIADLVKYGDLPEPINVDDVLKDAPSIAAYTQLLDRGLIDRDVVEKWRTVKV